jgi:hypothetical protein
MGKWQYADRALPQPDVISVNGVGLVDPSHVLNWRAV